MNELPISAAAPIGATAPAAFERVKASAAYAARNSPERLAQLPNMNTGGQAGSLFFLALFIGMALVLFFGVWFMFLGIPVAGGRDGWLLAFSLAFSAACLLVAAFGIRLLVRALRRIRQVAASPVLSMAALIVDKRSETSGGGEHSSNWTHYFVTCQTEDGLRHEYSVRDGKVYGLVTAGDAGVLFVRADWMLDFDRV